MSQSVEKIGDIIITDIDKAVDLAMDARVIQEEYKMWKKNSPFLYDIIMNHVLDQVSLTVQWFPDRIEVPGKDYSIQRLLLGTQGIDDEPNYLRIAEVRLPTEGKTVNETGSYGANSGKIEIIQQIVHDGDVHRARYMPQNPNIIASKSPSNDVLIFDRTQHSSKPLEGAKCDPQLRLTGHTKEGYGLNWSPLSQGWLASGSEDNLVCVWDINAKEEKENSISALHTFTGHTDVVEDVAFHSVDAHMLASCGDDKLICLWDTRTGNTATHSIEAHKAEVNSISFNQHDEHILASASSDHTVAMWDTRNLSKRLHSLEAHTNEVFTVMWAPFANNILASAGSDRRICYWDICRIGEEQSAEDAEDGPPELMFTHAGHTDKVNDMSWSLCDDWLMASVADDDVLQVWQVAAALREDEDDDDDEIDNDDLE